MSSELGRALVLLLVFTVCGVFLWLWDEFWTWYANQTSKTSTHPDERDTD